jgi:ribosomal protein L19
MSRDRLIEELEDNQLRKDIPDFRVGDTVKVQTKIVEGNKERIQTITGTVIAKRGHGVSETFALYRIAYGAAKEHGFIIKAIGAGDDRVDDYKKQEEYLKKHGSDFPQEIKIIETPRSASSTDVREKLKNEDFLGFKKMVPASVAYFYQSFVTALNDVELKESDELKKPSAESLTEGEKPKRRALKKSKNNKQEDENIKI